MGESRNGSYGWNCIMLGEKGMSRSRRMLTTRSTLGLKSLKTCRRKHCTLKGARRKFVVRAALSEEQAPKIEQVNLPLNGDPFVGMMETPVTSSPIVSNYLSNLPAYRIAVSPLLRGVEIGLAHGFFIVGPFIKLGPLRNSEAAEVAGCLSGAGLILILTACLTMYGVAQFQGDETPLKSKTLTGRTIISDPAKTPEGWSKFSAGFLFGGLSGVAWAYIMTQTLPFYS